MKIIKVICLCFVLSFFACTKEDKIELNALENQGGSVKIKIERTYPGYELLKDRTVNLKNGYDQESQELKDYGLVKLFDPNGDYFYATPIDCRAVLHHENLGIQESETPHTVYTFYYLRRLTNLFDKQRTSEYTFTIYKDSVPNLSEPYVYAKTIKTTFTVKCNTIRTK
jgi:hypothetical protein